MMAFCCVLLLYGQNLAQPVCGFDQSSLALKQADPSYRLQVDLNEQKIGLYIRQRKSAKPYGKKQTHIFNIPVVVHVLHTGEPAGTLFNPSDEQILDAIAYLNAIYDGTHPSLTPAGTDAAGDMGVRFLLAKRDPDCNPTTGIHRVDMSANADYVANGASNTNVSRDIAMKAPIAWDRSSYYNIYVVNKINGKDGTSGQFVAGYAYFPTSSEADGIVMLATQMKAGSKTLSHEMGHAFNLYHPFEGSFHKDQCPTGIGDHVDDTDPVSFNGTLAGVVDFTCRTGNNPCINAPYRIRTESNFMSYTNCYTLFTPGQRDRVQASLLLENRNSLTASAGAIPTYAAPACTPKINFEYQRADLAKTAIAETGCIKYSDYVFHLTIGGDPLQNASAVLFVKEGSTATEHSDFDFPSGKSISFPAGSNSSRSFILRVYDNGSTSETKLLTLGFSVDNGGGIAEKGSAIPDMDIYIQPHDLSPVVPGEAATASLGTFSNRIINARMFNATLHKQKTQLLYTADEISAAGLTAGSVITGLRFFVEKRSNRPLNNFNIKLAGTDKVHLAQNGGVQVVGDMTTVLSLPSYTTVNGWNQFVFSEPFTWDGNSSIGVEICFDNGAASAGAADIIHAYTDGSTDEQGNMIEDGSVNCSQSFASVNYYQNGIRPLMTLDYTRQGNPVSHTIAESKEAYLGPYNELYFYDKLHPQKIIAKIKNLSSWNYGCTSVRIDRDGEGAAPFWSNAASQLLTRKTFFVTPQHINAFGNYEITLYYTKEEKMSYEAATGNSWSQVKMIKTEVPVASVTPATPEVDKVSINETVEHGVFGGDYTVKAAFNTGFSGFSIGSIDAVLPVSWLNFEAVNREGNVQLHWSTAMEFNNSRFEVQVSFDAVNYTTIGTVPSGGNSSTVTDYAYTHSTPQRGKIYYRIRQVDFDGKSTYSKIIELFIAGSASPEPSLYPVPARENITVHFGKPVTHAVIEIIGSDMKSVYVEKINTMLLTKTIHTGRWASGTYIMRITSGKNSYVLKFVKL